MTLVVGVLSNFTIQVLDDIGGVNQGPNLDRIIKKVS